MYSNKAFILLRKKKDEKFKYSHADTHLKERGRGEQFRSKVNRWMEIEIKVEIKEIENGQYRNQKPFIWEDHQN